jgi:hypothetical protein
MAQTQAAFRDDFEEQGLKEGWEWIDPQSDCERSLTANKGWLRITVRGHHDLWPEANNFAAPRLLKEVQGDFLLETRVSSPNVVYGGLLVWKDERNFVRFERGIHFQKELNFQACENGEFVTLARDYAEGDLMGLRLERKGTLFTASYSADGKTWKPLKRKVSGYRVPLPQVADAASQLKEDEFEFEAGQTSVQMAASDPLRVGVSALCGGPGLGRAEESNTDFDYVELKRL